MLDYVFSALSKRFALHFNCCAFPGIRFGFVKASPCLSLFHPQYLSSYLCHTTGRDLRRLLKAFVHWQKICTDPLNTPFQNFEPKYAEFQERREEASCSVDVCFESSHGVTAFTRLTSSLQLPQSFTGSFGISRPRCRNKSPTHSRCTDRRSRRKSIVTHRSHSTSPSTAQLPSLLP